MPEQEPLQAYGIVPPPQGEEGAEEEEPPPAPPAAGSKRAHALPDIFERTEAMVDVVAAHLDE